MKRTHKYQVLKGDVGPVMASSTSVSEAARRLGISRATLHDWIKAGKAPKPSGRSAPRRVMHGHNLGPKAGQSVTAWARRVRGAYDLTGGEELLLRLAVRAYGIGMSATAPLAIQLSAQGRVAALLKQLNLEGQQHGDAKEEPLAAPAVITWPRRIG